MRLRFKVTSNGEPLPMKVVYENGKLCVGQVMFKCAEVIYNNGLFEFISDYVLHSERPKTIKTIKCPKDLKWQVEECLEINNIKYE